MSKVQLFLLRGICQIPAYVAYQKGFFAEESVQIVNEQPQSGPRTSCRSLRPRLSGLAAVLHWRKEGSRVTGQLGAIGVGRRHAVGTSSSVQLFDQ